MTSQDNYDFYKSLYPQDKVTKSTFIAVCGDMNTLVSDWILEGNTFDMGSYMGSITIKRYKRVFRLREDGTPNLPINWNETRKLKEAGIDKKVYHTDEYYCGWRWSRGKCKVPGKGAYKFKANRTNGTECKSGNINKLVHLLKSDELAYLRFKLVSS